MAESTEEELIAVQAIISLRCPPSSQLPNDNDFQHKTKTIMEAKPKRKRIKQYIFRQHELIPFATKPNWGMAHLPNTDPAYSIFSKLLEFQNREENDSFRKFMREICIKDVEFILEYDGLQNPFGPNNRHFFGVECVSDFFLTVMSKAPDAMMRVVGEPKGHLDTVTGVKFLSCRLMIDLTVVFKVVAQANNADTQNTNNTQNDDDVTTLGCSSGDDLECLISGLATFSLTPLETTPVRTYHCLQYFCDINPEGMITRLCSLMRIEYEYPTSFVQGPKKSRK